MPARSSTRTARWLRSKVPPCGGLSMALHERSEFVKGSAKDTNLDIYTPLRMGDVPEVQAEFIASPEAPLGLGEPATTVVAPAIGNAIFAATGARVRRLPIR